MNVTPSSSGSAQTDLAVRILKYFQSNPQAKDTLEGIAEWWLAREKIDETIEHVEGALDFLMQQGMIRQEMLPNQTTIYKINSEKKRQILTYIKAHERKEPE